MSTPLRLSKSRLLAYRQCPRRLWLEIHRRDLLEVTAAQQARFDAGHAVGEIARRLADPEGVGLLFDAQRDGFETVLRVTQHQMAERRPMFEAAFATQGAIALVDVLLPAERVPEKAGGQAGSEKTTAPDGWHLIEVKSSGSVKAYHWDDLAVQVHVLREAGVPLVSASVACIDTAWVYPGGGDYRGLLRNEEGLAQAIARDEEVGGWISHGLAIAQAPDEPQVAMGAHCQIPFDCPFQAHCANGQPQAMYPVQWLPRVQRKDLKAFIHDRAITDMSQVPDHLLTAQQRRVKEVTVSGQAWFDAEGARRALAPHSGTGRFLDFEAAARPIPVWPGTRPYQQMPFQFSLHTLHADGRIEHDEFIDLSGDDPSEAFAARLIEVCGDTGPIFVYNAGFEGQVIDALGRRQKPRQEALQAIRRRLVDLKPITEQHYYHPGQKGSWSLKRVLPTLGGEASHADLDGVADGQMAVEAYLEATDPETPPHRVQELREQLLRYCRLDTWALVTLWRFLAGTSGGGTP